MDERSLGGTEFRGDLYKILCSNLNETRTGLHSVPGYAELSHANQIRMSKSRANFYDVLELMAFPVAARQYMQDKINPVHRPVIEELMVDLQSLLDAMPQEEKASVPDLDERMTRAREAKETRAKLDLLERQSEVFARKTWICPDHGVRPWQSKPGVLRGWCHKELADGTECGHELVEKPKPLDAFRPPGMFHNA